MNDEAYDTLLKRLTEARGTFDWNSTKGLVAASCAVHRACWEFQRDLSNALSIYQAADDDQPELPFQARGWPNLAKWLDELKQSLVEYIKNCGLRGYLDESGLLAGADVIMELYEAEGQQDGYEAPAIAAEMLRAVVRLQECRAENDADEAIRIAMQLGELLNQNDFLDEYRTGRRVIMGGVGAAEAKWGTEKQRLRKKADLLRLFKEERPRWPSDDAAYAAVAKRANVKKRTVRRAVTGH